MALIINVPIVTDSGFEVTGAYVKVGFFQRHPDQNSIHLQVLYYKSKEARNAEAANIAFPQFRDIVTITNITNADIAAGNIFGNVLYPKLKEAIEQVLGEDTTTDDV